MKDSLWSLDLFRCESIALQTYWVLVVMDQYTRESSDSASNAESSMAWRFAGCSSKQYEVQGCRNMSAPITIRCTGFINGRRTFEFWA